MRAIQRGISTFLLGMLLLTLGMPLVAAQDASPVVETPTPVPEESVPVSSPSSTDPIATVGDEDVVAQDASEPTFTFSCAVTSLYTATISYEFNDHGNQVNLWFIRDYLGWGVNPSEVGSTAGSPTSGTLSLDGYYGVGSPVNVPLQTGYSNEIGLVLGSPYVTCTNVPSTATVTPPVTATTAPTQTGVPSVTATSGIPSPTATGTPPSATSTSAPTGTATATAVTPATGTVIVRVETADGSDLPDGLQACVDDDCQPLGALASTQLMALSLPSGSGVVFSDVPVGVHTVTVRDAGGNILSTQQVTVVQGETTEMMPFVLDFQPAPTATSVPPTAASTATTVAVSGLPSTGQGTGGGSSLPMLLLGLSAMALVAGFALSQRRRMRG